MEFRSFVNALELNSHIRVIRIDFLNKGIPKWHERHSFSNKEVSASDNV